MILSSFNLQNLVLNLEYGEGIGFLWFQFGYVKMSLDKREIVKKIQKIDQIWGKKKSDFICGGFGELGMGMFQQNVY